MIHVIGMGEDGPEGLTSLARHLIEQADLLVGGQRHLEMIDRKIQKISWGRGLEQGMAALRDHRHQNCVVLATGEPMWFGIAVTLLKEFDRKDIHIIGHVGAFAMAGARMGWGLQHVACLSVHGRALETLHRAIHDGARLLILSRDGKTPRELADMLCQYGYGASKITVFEHMGGPQEKVLEGTATGWQAQTADLNTIALECHGDAGARRLPLNAGLDDALFDHDGQLTKSEVRAVTLSALAPTPGERLWDVGAGCGSIAIEWMRLHGQNKAIAIEQNDKRRGFIARNGAALGVPDLEILAAKAPEGLEGLARPDAIFIGGGISQKGLLETCFNALPSGGRLVANTVTLEAEREMLHFQARFGGTLTRIAISRQEQVGRLHALKPMAPVLQLKLIKE